MSNPSDDTPTPVDERPVAPTAILTLVEKPDGGFMFGFARLPEDASVLTSIVDIVALAVIRTLKNPSDAFNAEVEFVRDAVNALMMTLENGGERGEALKLFQEHVGVKLA